MRQILEMIRFSHTLFALPFALLAAVLAWTTKTINGQTVVFRWQDLLGILICMVAARSAAMAFNRLVDREIDAANPRTANRHLPSGKLSIPSVWAFTILCSLGFVLATWLFLPNRLPMFLSVPVLGILFAYSYTKRVTWAAHFWLGFCLMLAPVAAWIATRGEAILANPLDVTPAFMLGLAVLFWVTGFDIIYACQDTEFDREAKLKSVPARYGVPGGLRIAAISHFVMIVILFALPWVVGQAGLEIGFGWIYLAGVAAVAVLLAYEHSLVRPHDLRRVNMAFFNVNAIVSFGLFLVGVVDVLL